MLHVSQEQCTSFFSAQMELQYARAVLCVIYKSAFLHLKDHFVKYIDLLSGRELDEKNQYYCPICPLNIKQSSCQVSKRDRKLLLRAKK